MADEYARFQPLNELALQDVEEIAVGNPQYTIDRRGITICVVAEEVGVDGGCTIDIIGSQDDEHWGMLGLVNAEGQHINDIYVTENGTWLFEVVNASSLVWTNAVITEYIDGKYNVRITGGCQ